MWRGVQTLLTARKNGSPPITAEDVDVDALNDNFLEIVTNTSRTVDRLGDALPVRLPQVSTGSFALTYECHPEVFAHSRK